MVNNVNEGAQNDLCTLHTSCDAPPTKQQCSQGVDLLTLSEYRINERLTLVKAQVTDHRRCESMNAQSILPGRHYSV